MFGSKKPLYSNRLSRDLAELYEHDYSCSSSLLSVDPDSSMCGVTLHVCIFDGPYSRGHFSFYFSVPNNYPFKMVEVWSKHPIYHPNIDLFTGKVALPLEWSPVLTLRSLAVAVQMMLLEPSSESILNNEACSYYADSPVAFEEIVQKTLRGGRYGDVDFPPVVLSAQHPCSCSYCGERGNKGGFKGGASSSSGCIDQEHEMSLSPTARGGLSLVARAKRGTDDADDSTAGMPCTGELTPMAKRPRSDGGTINSSDDVASYVGRLHKLSIDKRNGGADIGNAAFMAAVQALADPRSDAAMVVDSAP